MNRKISLALMFIAFLGLNLNLKAQLSGVYNVPSTYTSIGSAIIALNTSGVSGAVTIAIAAGHTETATVGGYTLNSILGASSTNSVVFQKTGAGANPRIIAYTGGTGTPASVIQDGVWRFIGTDYVTIDGVDIQDNNTTNPSTMEFGYGFFKANAGNGCQYNAIINSTITLNRINNATGSGAAVDGSRGIHLASSTNSTQTTVLTVTSSAGSNSFNRFYSNTIQNCNYGIALIGFADVTPFTFADNGNDIGGTSSLTGNTIINFGGGAATSPASAIRTLAQYNLNVGYNLINNNNGSGVNHTTTLRGIYINTALSANSTISNNTITLRANGTTAQVTPIENVSGSTAANNTITINNNLITNCTYTTATTGVWYGIWNNAASANHLLISGNTFSNNSTNGTSGAYYPIYNTGAVTGSISINDNVFSGITFSAATTSITNYNIYLTSIGTAGTLNINGNSFANYNWVSTNGSTGAWGAIFSSVTSSMQTIQGNTFNNLNIKTSSTLYMIYCNSSGNYISVNSNSVITGFSRSYGIASSGTTYFIYNGTGTTNRTTNLIYNNNFSNFNNGLCSGTIGMLYWFHGALNTDIYNNTFDNINASNGTGTFYGLYGPYYGINTNVYNNTFSNITYGTGTLYGIYFYNYYATLANVYNNNISNIQTAGANVYGFYNYIGGGLTAGAVTNIYRNKITDIGTSNTNGAAYGFYEAGLYTNQNHNIYNNLIGNITASLSSNANAVNGIYISPSALYNVNCSYNSVYLAGTSSGNGFGSSALYGNSSYPYSLRNNIFVNNTTPTGTGLAAAHKRSNSTLTTYSLNSNNNLFYAGVPSASNVIFTDGSTTYSTLAAYKALLTTGQDASSVSENAPFASITGTNSNFLAISTTVATQIESGGVSVSGITNDYAGTTRNASTPDIGAWEGNYILNDLNPPSFSNGNFSAPACTSTLGVYTVNINDPSGVATGSLAPKVYYSYNGGATNSVTGVLASGTASIGVWSFSLNYAGTTGGIVAYYLVAQDATTLSNVASLPAAGFTGVNVNSVTTAPNTPNLFTVQGALSGTYSVGSGQTFTTLTDAVNAYNTSCLAGPVTFELTDALYSTSETFPIVIQNNLTANSTNQLLIKPASGNNATITANLANAIIKMNGADYITFNGSNNGTTSKNLTVENTSTVNTSVAFWLGNGSAVDAASNLTIQNAIITGSTGLTSAAGIIIGSGVSFGQPSDIPNNNISVIGNTFMRFQQAVFGSGLAGNPDQNWLFMSNYCGSTLATDKLGFRGFLIQNAQSVGILSNTISGISNPNASGNGYGIFLSGNTFNNTVSFNVLNDIKNTNIATTYGFSGIALSSTSPTANILVSNNFISDISNYGSASAGITFNAYGIIITSGAGYKIYHNSVLMNAAPILTTAIPAPMFISSGVSAVGAIDLRNNIFANTQTVSAQRYAIYSQSTNSLIYSNINHNAYVTTGPNLGFISSARSNMAAIQLGFGGNLNSTTIAPVFTSPSDLHLPVNSNALFDDLGTPVVGVTTDFDGQTRSSTTPDIGADEYTSPPCSGSPMSNAAITNSAVICPSVAVNFSLASSYSVTGITYQWFASTTGSTSGFASVSNATQSVWTATDIAVTTWYQCVATCSNSGLSTTSSPIDVSINTPTNVLTIPNLPAVCPGQNVNLAISGTLPPGYTYQWMASTTASNSGYTNLPSTASNVAVTNQTANTWYQVQMSCTTNTLITSFSTPTLVPLGMPFTTLNSIASASVLCYTNSVNLSLSGTGSGLAFSWLASTTNSTSGYSAIPGATLATRTATGLVGPTWFQSAVSCSAAPVFSILSNPVFVSAGSTTNTAPYFEGFEGITANNQLPNCSWIASSPSLICLTYTAPQGTYNRAARTGSKFASYRYGTNTAGDYFYSNGILLNSGQSYSATMYYVTDGLSGWSEVNMMYGTAQNSLSMVSIASATGALTNTTYTAITSLFTPTATGIYYLGLKCIGTSAPWYLSIDDISVIPINNCSGTPGANTSVASQTQVCSGGGTTVNFSNTTVYAGIVGLTYSWASSTSSVGPFSTIPTETLATLNATNVTSATWYQGVVTCTNGGASTTISPIQIAVQSAPVYTNTPFLETFDATWENRCGNRNVPKAAYWESNPTSGNNSWRRQDDGLSGAWTNTASGAIAPLSGTGCARFHSYDASSGTSGELKLYLDMTSASPNYSLTFYHINTSGTDVLNVHLSTDGGTTFSNIATYGLSGAWSKKIINLGPVNSSSCIISFSATSDYGVTDIGIDSLEVKTCPNVMVTASSASVCPGAVATLSVSGANGYRWFNFASTPTLNVNPTSSTVYSVTGSNGVCAISQTVQVDNFPSPILAVSGTSAVCNGLTASLTASGANTYTWNNSVVNASINQTLTSNSTFTVIGTSVDGCTSTATESVLVNPNPNISILSSPSVCAGQSIGMSVSGASSYLWDNSSTSTSITVTPTTNTTYSVTGTDALGCQTTTTQLITITANPLVTITGASSVCTGQSLNLTAGGASTYTWDNGSNNTLISITPTSNTTYTVIGTDSQGCFATATQSVSLAANPVLTFAGSTGICTGQNASLTVSGANTYTWNTGSNSNSIVTSPAVSTTYTVTGVDLLGCSTTSTQLVTVAASLTITIAGPTSICVGQAANLTGNGGVTYTWDTGANTQTIAPSPTVTTTYSIIGASGTCSNTGVTTITVNPNPTVSISGSLSICADQTSILTGSGASSYTWSSGALTSTTSVTPGSYTLTGSNSFGCTNDANVNVLPLPLPNISVAQSNATVCVNSAASFTASGASTYTWSTASNNTIITITPTVAANYTVVGTNSLGCVSSSTFALATFSLPILTISPASATVCSLSQASFNANGATTYTWNGSILTQTAAFNPATSSVYTLSGTNGLGCVSTVTLGVTTNTLPILTISPPSATVCSATNASFTASGANSYTWSGSVISSSVVFVPSVTTVYTVTGVNSAGCRTTNSITVGTNTLPAITISPASASVCALTTTSYTPTGANTYTWTNTNNTLVATSGVAAITPTAAAIYSVTGTNGFGCVSTRTLAVGVFALPSLTITPASPTICANSLVTFTANGANTYTWNNTINTQTASFNPSISTVYTLTGTNINSCVSTVTIGVTTNTLPIISINSSTGTVCAFSPVTYTASGADTYTWSNNSQSNPVTLFPPGNTTYSVSGTNTFGCISSNTISVVTNSLPLITVSPSLITICALETTTMTAGGASTYSWSTGSTAVTTTVNPSTTTAYSVVGTDALGCVGIGNAVIVTNTLPIISVSSSSATVCANSTVSLTASGANSYTWNTGSNGTTITVTPSVNTTYSVVGSDPNNGCLNSQTIAVSTLSLPIVTVASSASSVCPGATATLTASGANVYLWNNGLTNTIITTVVNTATVYNVQGTDTSGCSSSGSVAVGMFNLPSISVSPANPTICLGEVASLTASGANTYTWIPSNTNSSTFTLSPTTISFYTVSGTDANNCTNKTTVLVSVSPCTGLYENVSASQLINVFPNPSRGIVTAEFDFDGTKELTIVNALGQLILGIKTENHQETFDLSPYAKGIYYIKIKSNQVSTNYRVIIE